MCNAYGVYYHVTFSIKVYCCEQDLNLRRENLLDFKTNTFIARPSQELEGQEGGKQRLFHHWKGLILILCSDLGLQLGNPVEIQAEANCKLMNKCKGRAQC